MDRVKRLLGQEDEEDTSLITDISEASSLSWSTRLKCFAACFVLGVSCSVLGAIAMWRNIRLFAALYTVGNLSTLAGTCFLMGPVKQLKQMFKEKRLIASIVMIVSLVLTLLAAFWWKKKLLALMFVVIQYLAMTWYCLSYIPFARDAVKKCCESCMA